MRGVPTTLVFLSTLLFVTGGCATTPSTPPPGPDSRDLSACFYDFTDVYVKRIHGVLTRAPGASNVHRIRPQNDEPERCICYALIYDRPMEELDAWLRKELPTSNVVPFRLKPVGENRLEVYFDGGFK
jgi:hypothetical protein